MTNDEKKREDSPEDRTPWYGKPMDTTKPPEGEEVVITEDSGGVIEVDEKGEVRVPGQDPPFAPEPDAPGPDEQPQPEPPVEQPVVEHTVPERAVDPLSVVEPTEKIRVVRVIDMFGPAEEIKSVLDTSFLGAGEGVTTGDLTMIEKERHYLKGGDYIVTMIKNVSKDG
ncbi:MAG: hypothetical protein ACYTDW_01385 [Planctomycetota bacterium]|jgi:hypothetical protein